ncbi:MAG: carbohydrate ABC transporter permease [Thermoleophilaceae bacterium]|nr:carbohydrate ABC transporter permease [Thermoleophilaceae bacterium]
MRQARRGNLRGPARGAGPADRGPRRRKLGAGPAFPPTRAGAPSGAPRRHLNLTLTLVDGATHFQAFRKVVLPLAAPGLVTAGLLTAFFMWNEFLLAVTLTSSASAFTVPVAVNNFQASQLFEIPLGTISAASVVITIPLVVLVIIFQKRIVAGMTAGAVKG